ncbi:hypothetical protein BJY01DRAFT_72223 [Aspergillus pseudoustus]|uniref:Uncharacterized protein n=1 Tax=Aspergillus pseudoustus TaxID=1810923 RepID=A0ABR4L0E1_9EURO
MRYVPLGALVELGSQRFTLTPASPLIALYYFFVEVAMESSQLMPTMPELSDLVGETHALKQQVVEINLCRANLKGRSRVDNPPDSGLATSLFLDEVDSALGILTSRKAAEAVTHAAGLDAEGLTRAKSRRGEWVCTCGEKSSAEDSNNRVPEGHAGASMDSAQRQEEIRKRRNEPTERPRDTEQVQEVASRQDQLEPQRTELNLPRLFDRRRLFKATYRQDKATRPYIARRHNAKRFDWNLF